jgi:glycosyltransferase involved in cell wall biosynthesis
MRILIIHEIDWEKKVIFEPHHLAELFSMQGHDVFVIDCRDANLKEIREAMKTEEIRNYHRVYDDGSITLIRPPSISIRGLNRISYFLFCKKIIRETIVKNKIDVILLYGTATNGIQTINVAEKLDIPVFYRLLDVTHSLVKTPIIRQLAKKNESTVIRKATKVLPIIPDLQRYAIEMGAKMENTEIFPLGINRKLFKKLPKNKKLLQELKINEKDKIVLFIGTLFEFSGLEKIIKKYEIILNKNPNTKFLIIGGGVQFNRLESLIKKKNLESKIIMTGFLPQQILPEYLSLANICIQPFDTNYITNRILPSKILEYFACGKAVLSTPLEGTVEILPDESFGIIYSSQNNFVEKLSELLSDETKLKELGRQGYDYVIQNHDWNILSNKIIEKFELVKSKF